MKFCFCFVFFLYFTQTTAQNGFGVGSSMMKAEISVVSTDSFSIYNNPATLSSDSIFVGLSAKQYYLIEGLNEFTGAASFPSAIGSIGAGINYYGDEFYNESSITVGISRKLTNSVSAGVSLLFVNHYAEFAENANTIFPHFGLKANISEEFTLAAAVLNPFSQDLPKTFDQQLESRFSIGGNYHPNKEFQTSFQLDLLENQGMSTGLGFSYKFLNRFEMLLGGRLNPGFLSAGFGIHLSKLNVSVGSQFHNELGVSPLFTAESRF